MRSVLILLILAIVGISSTDLVADSGAFRLDQADLARLSRGEVIVQTDQSENGQKGRVEAAILIRSPAAQIWSVMVDCDHASEFIPGLKSCHVMQHGEDAEIIQHRVRFSWLIPTVTYVFRANYDRFKRVDFKRISGDLRELEGSWILERVDDGHQTIVIYSVYIDPGFFIPQWLVRVILRKNLPDLLSAVRNRVSELFRHG